MMHLSALPHSYTRRRTSHLIAHFTRPNTVFHIIRTRTKIAFAKLCIATLANYHYTISVATSTCICMPGCPVSHAWSPTQTVNILIDQAGFNGQKLSISPLHKPLHYSTVVPGILASQLRLLSAANCRLFQVRPLNYPKIIHTM